MEMEMDVMVWFSDHLVMMHVSRRDVGHRHAFLYGVICTDEFTCSASISTAS